MLDLTEIREWGSTINVILLVVFTEQRGQSKLALAGVCGDRIHF